MRKIPNHSTNDNKKSKKINDAIQGEKPVKQLVFGEYFNIHTFLKHPVTLSFIERQAQDLRAWAMSDDALLLYDFTDQVGYSPNQFYEWCDKYPVLREAHDFALRRIGARRERGALTRQFAESTIHRTLGHYHKIWKDETLEMYRMKDNIAQAENKIIIDRKSTRLNSSHSQISYAVFCLKKK